MNKKQLDFQRNLNETWYWYLTGKHKNGYTRQYEITLNWLYRTSKLVPGSPRCVECNLPMAGVGSWIMTTRPSNYNPRLCNKCEKALREQEAGAEVELTMLFADVRGSTSLAQTTSTDEFKGIIQRFYRTVTDVLIQHNALVNRLMGDQVIGLFVPRFSGPGYTKVAIDAAVDILRATGHADPAGPWIPVGIGIHTGVAYVGAVGTPKGVNEIAVLGSAPNLAARLSSQAADGEVIVSEEAVAAAELTAQGLEHRTLELKGVDLPVEVGVLRVKGNQASR